MSYPWLADMAGKIEFVFNDSKAVCDVCGETPDLRLVKFRGLFQSWLICRRCLLASAELLMMNEGVN